LLHSSRSRRITLSLALTLAVTTATACGDDDDEATGAPTVPAEASVPTEACDAYVGLGTAMTGDPAAAGDAIDAFTTTVPEALTDEAAVIGETYAALAEGGDPSAFGEPEFIDASAAVAEAYFAGCDPSEVLEVSGIDYGFEGIPNEIDAGRVAIRFTNDTTHDEAHEMVLFRRNDGVDDPIEDLLALPEDEAFSKLTMAGVVFADAAGSEATTMVDLEPGSYAAICFIPTGGGEDGPPHFTSGMVAEFDAA
jgi:hypothetical protein